MLVTVVTPSYNRLPLLRQCLASVASQSHQDWECLVCDDGSTDGTHEFVRELSSRDQRFRLVLGPRFGLPAGPRNRGIAEAKGEWIAFVDDDDLWHPEKLSRQAQIVSKGDVDAVATELVMFSEDHVPAWQTHDPRTGAESLKLDGILRLQRPYPSTPTNLIRRDRLFSVGGFSEHAAYRALEDYDLWSRLQAFPGFRWVAIGGPPLAAAREAGSDSISSWNRLPSSEYTRQRWAILEIFTRILAAERESLCGALPDLMSALINMADECAHRSRLLGWRGPALFAYRLAARFARATGDHAGAAKRATRAVRFGLFGRAVEPGLMPNSVPQLQSRIGRYCNAILAGESLRDDPIPISPGGKWSSLAIARPHVAKR